MVLSFALCATFAFAQVKTAKNLNSVQNNVVSVSAPSMSQADYKASIFTKDDEVLRTWDFAAPNEGYSFGTITSAEALKYSNGDIAPVHAAQEAFAQWNRIAGVDSNSLAAAAVIFTRLDQWLNLQRRIPSYMDSTECSAPNGFAMISLLGIADYSAVAVDSYIEFSPIDLSADGVYDAAFGASQN